LYKDAVWAVYALVEERCGLTIPKLFLILDGGEGGVGDNGDV
jgi:hypothetical protein